LPDADTLTGEPVKCVVLEGAVVDQSGGYTPIAFIKADSLACIWLEIAGRGRFFKR